MALNIPNLKKLIARMRTLRPEQFNIKYLWTDKYGRELRAVPDLKSCGTAACIAGECGIIAGAKHNSYWDASNAREWLGLEGNAADELFCPVGFYEKSKEFPLARAIDVLCHLRDTGEVRWSLFPAQNYLGEPWSAPQATEIKEPQLPEALTRLLGAKVEA